MVEFHRASSTETDLEGNGQDNTVKDLEANGQDNIGAQATKSIVLLLLVVQNVASILSMKQASRQQTSDGLKAISTSVVLISEVVKVTICLTEICVRYVQ